MKRLQVLWQKGDRQWLVAARDPERPGHIIDTNEYLVVAGEQALLTDPGGSEVFPAVFSAIAESFDPRRVVGLFASHQDPDVISSLGLWLEFNPRLTCHLSWMWTTFVSHFGGRSDNFAAIPDPGRTIALGRARLEAIPAHHLHSPGNFHLYDPEARILFSGDVGAALLPPGQDDLFVTDFDRHIRHAEGFHRRWMGSNEAKQRWCEQVAALEIDLLCPQHGAIYRGDDVPRFIDWFSALEVGAVEVGPARRAA